MGIRKYRGQILCDKRWPDGKRFKRQYPNRKQAQSMLDDIEHSIKHGYWRDFREDVQLRNRDRVTLKDFSETYLEEYAAVRNKKQAYRRKVVAFNSINPRLGSLSLEEVTAARVHNYVRKRKKDGVSDATINREITILKHCLNYAVEIEVLEANLLKSFRLLREERKERRRYREEEVTHVVNMIRADCRPIFVFMKETGCRREEALSLKHSQVQLESKLVVFDENTKSRKYRYVPLTEVAIEAVQTLLKLPDCPYVFYNPKSKTRWKYCRRAWEAAREAAGFPEMQAKDLRRHYAIALAEGGADMHDIQQVLGHSSVATTEMYYAQFSPRHSARKILRVLQGGSGSGTKTELSENASENERENTQAPDAVNL